MISFTVADGGWGRFGDGGPLGEGWVACGPFVGEVDVPIAEPRVSEVRFGGI